MNYLNHYTLNTGHNRKSYSNEVNKGMYFMLNRLIQEAMKNEFVDVLDGTVMKLTIEGSSYVITLFNNIKEKNPLLVTFGCKYGKDATNIVKEANSFYKKIYNEESKIVPITPFCLDIVLPSLIFYPQIAEWTGDFCRCMAWSILSPEKIR